MIYGTELSVLFIFLKGGWDGHDDPSRNNT